MKVTVLEGFGIRHETVSEGPGMIRRWSPRLTGGSVDCPNTWCQRKPKRSWQFLIYFALLYAREGTGFLKISLRVHTLWSLSRPKSTEEHVRAVDRCRRSRPPRLRRGSYAPAYPKHLYHVVSTRKVRAFFFTLTAAKRMR